MLGCWVCLVGQVWGKPSWRPPELRVADPPPVTEAGPLLERALKYLGYPYAYGGVGSPAFDCSGFVCRVYAESGWAVPRVSRDQARAGRPVPLDELRPGDLVFFADRGRPISHVGIYLGDGSIVHASSGRGEVSLANLSQRWFRTRLVGARRILHKTPRFAPPEVVVTELEEHQGRSRLSPMVDRPSAFPEPGLGFRLTPPEGTGVGLRALFASEAERWGAVLVPEASFVHPPWGLEVTAAVPVRFEPDRSPTVGPIDDFADATKFLRRARLGLPGARLEVAFERLGSYRLVDSELVRDLSPALRSAGLPGLSVARSPLTLYAGYRPEFGAAEVLLDDVLDPRIGGGGLALKPLEGLSVRALGITDQASRYRPPATPESPTPGSVARAVTGTGLGLDFEWRRARRMAFGFRAEGQAVHALGQWGFGAEGRLTARARLGARTPTTLGLDLKGGVAGSRFLFGFFGPTYLVGREAHLTALETSDAARAVLGGQALVRRGKFALRLAYDQGVGPEAQALDRTLAGVVDYGGLSLGGPRTLDLRVAYAARAPFRASQDLHVLAASLRLRFTSWLGVEAFAQGGETLEGGVGLTMTWVP